jgi:protease-4
MARSNKEVWFWRFLAFFLLFFLWKPHKDTEISKDSIVRTEIYGIITYDPYLLSQIEKIKNNPKIKAVILRVNSPGGTIVGGESLYRALKGLAKEKPLYSLVEDTATSGGYMALLPSKKIFTYETSTLGSIGVFTDYFDFTGLMEKLGISYHAIKSSQIKNGINPFEKTTPEAIKAMEDYVGDCQVIFKRMVTESRPQIKNLDLIANGAIFTGAKALSEGLIDAIGSEEDLIKALEADYQIKNLPIIDYQILSPQQDNHDSFNPIKRLLDFIL